MSRTACFLLFVAASLLLFHEALISLWSLSWSDDRYTHTVVIPLISLAFLYYERHRIFAAVQYQPVAGATVAAVGAVVYFLVRIGFPAFGEAESLALETSAVILAWVAGFVFCYGARCAKAALFPLSLLVLVVPLPPHLVEFVEVALQNWSAEMTHAIFRITGTPVYREGLVFSLPGLNIEVAKQCSGIRSSTSLLITSLLLGRLFLRSNWRRAWLVVLTIPIGVFKNAVRITTLSWLGAFVSQDYLHGMLHHRGGPVFAALGFALLLPVLWGLRRGDERRAKGSGAAGRNVCATRRR